MIPGILLVWTLLAGFCPAEPEMTRQIRLYESGQYPQAASAFEGMALAYPKCLEVRLWQAKSYLKLRRWNDAVDLMEGAIKQDPANARSQLWLGRAYGQKASHSFLFSAFGLAKKVVRAFETALRLDPSNTDIRFDLMEFYLEAPGIVGGGKDKAAEQAKAIGELDRRLGYVANARIQMAEKQWQNAHKELVKATQEFPKLPDAFGDLAEYLFRREDFRGAQEAADKALALHATYAKAILVRAAACIRLGKELDSAAAALRSLSTGPLRDEDPTFQEVYYWLGQACVGLGDKTEARKAFSTALKFDPDYEAAKRALSQLS